VVKADEQHRQYRDARRLGQQSADFRERIFPEHDPSIPAAVTAIVHPGVKHQALCRR
jgi:hypothetical protein